MPKAAKKKQTRKSKDEAVTQSDSTALVKHESAGVVAIPRYSQEHINLIKSTVAKGVTDAELQWFLYVSAKLKLDPLSKQIHAVKRKQKDRDTGQWIEVMSIQTSIDGFRAIADRTRCYAPSDRIPIYDYSKEPKLYQKFKQKFNSQPPYSVTVFVKKFTPIDGTWHEYSGTAVFDEFCPLTKEDGDMAPPFMWCRMGTNQIEKCSESKALRRGFPNEFEGVYTTEEMSAFNHEQQTDEPRTGAHGEKIPANKRARERATLEPGKSENRGHGNEGFEDKKQPQTIDATPVETTAATQKAEKPQPTRHTIKTKIERVNPRMKRLTDKQQKENVERKQKGEPELEPQPFYEIIITGNKYLYLYDKHVFEAAFKAKGRKYVELTYEEHINERTGATFLSLVDIHDIEGVKFARDPETNDCWPVEIINTKAPQKKAETPAASTEDASLFTD